MHILVYGTWIVIKYSEGHDTDIEFDFYILKVEVLMAKQNFLIQVMIFEKSEEIGK